MSLHFWLDELVFAVFNDRGIFMPLFEQLLMNLNQQHNFSIQNAKP